MKKIISFLLMAVLLIPIFTVSYAEPKSYESEYLPEGELYFTTFGYHDTWTNAWEDWDNDLSEKGTLLPRNQTKTYDKGKPNTVVTGSGNTLKFDLGKITK